jgi:membrane-bound lytic murein transglycosylase D
MKKSDKLLFATLGSIVIGVMVIAMLNGQSFIPTSCASTVPADTIAASNVNITTITPPTEAYLFDKKIPLDNWEVRERFERELYYNYANSDQLVLWWKRLARWEPMIDSMFETAGLPKDFKYLMIAESGIKNVSSPAKASGFWQFIPATAQQYGFRIDQWIDDRLDPIISTQGAVKYLARLKNMFGGDYFLVAASYNMGESGVKENLDFQHQTSYWNLYLNEETMRYPLRIAAIKELLEHPARYGFHFEKMTPYQKYSLKTILLHGPVEIADWTDKEGYSYKDFKIFNPRFIARTIPSGTYEVHVPATNADRTTVK